MNGKIQKLFIVLVWFAGVNPLAAQNTAFTYQGRLNDGNAPANGNYNLTFSLFNTNISGGAIAGPVTNNGVSITNGLFTALIDFGSVVWNGQTNWLQIGVESNGVGGFTTLLPRQQITPTPYAVFANTASNLISGLTVQQNADGAPNVIGGASVNFAANGVEGATIGGGGSSSIDDPNNVTADFGTVGGGIGNVAGSYGATVGGGENNTASGTDATVSGGGANIASGDYSFAAGQEAEALNNGSFVWSDDSGGVFASTAENQFSVRAAGGIRLAGDVGFDTSTYHHLSLSGGNSTGYLYGSYPGLGDGVHLGYNFYYTAAGDGVVINSGGGTSRISADYGEIQLATGGTGVTAIPVVRLDISTTAVTVENASFSGPPSDRNVKQDFAAVSPVQILEKVAQLPITEWSYKFEPAKRHVGPIAQDFYSTFDVGTDDKHIAPVDEGGVALAAIQGLNQKLTEESKAKDAEIQNLKQSVTELKAMVLQLMQSQASSR